MGKPRACGNPRLKAMTRNNGYCGTCQVGAWKVFSVQLIYTTLFTATCNIYNMILLISLLLVKLLATDMLQLTTYSAANRRVTETRKLCNQFRSSLHSNHSLIIVCTSNQDLCTLWLKKTGPLLYFQMTSTNTNQYPQFLVRRIRNDSSMFTCVTSKF